MAIDQGRMSSSSMTFKLSTPTMCLNTTFWPASFVGQGDSLGQREQTGPLQLNQVSLTTLCKRYLFLSFLLLGIVFNLARQPVAAQPSASALGVPQIEYEALVALCNSTDGFTRLCAPSRPLQSAY